MEGGGAGVPPQRVCFFGTYARGYTVTRALMHACRAAGFETVECNERLWEEVRTKQEAYFAASHLFLLLARYLRCAGILRRRLRSLPEVDCFVVGFQGQLDILLLRVLLARRRKQIVFFPLVTLTETLVDDRKIYKSTSLRAYLARLLDAASLRAASRVALDTAAHQAFAVHTFGLPKDKLSVWYLGCDNDAFAPGPVPVPGAGIRVLFYGSFLPLHGTQTIVAAAALLADEGVSFELAGEGADEAAVAAFIRERQLRNVRLSPWRTYEELSSLIAGADVCLGVFGGGQKAQWVIPNKVYQCAAVGRAIITADTPAVREVFTHRETAWLCPPADAAALAAAVRTLCDDRDLRLRLGRNAAKLMAERFSPRRQGEALARILTADRAA